MGVAGRSLATFALKQSLYCLNLPEIGTKFLDVTSGYAIQGLNPGGIYKGIWTRDASFIVQDWFLSGKDVRALLDAVVNIWSHQITTTTIENDIPVTKQGRKVLYGRGSPKLDFCMTDSAALLPKHRFRGALPTTIFDNFAEVYAAKPDIDSTALMISATSSILTALVEKSKASSSAGQQPPPAAENAQEEDGDGSFVSYPYLLQVVDDLVPRMLEGIEYLKRQDIDSDGLLEQGHNEDWMDTALRSGKIVYSQACWLLALRGLCSLLTALGYSEQANKMLGLAKTTIHEVEAKLWSENNDCYIDSLQHPPDGGGNTSNAMLTQDVSLYLVALSEYLADDLPDGKQGIIAATSSMPINSVFEGIPHYLIYDRAHKTLDALRNRVWTKNEFEWPLVTERALGKTGPRMLDVHEYHNHAFWPWITGIEMLARSRFGRLDESLSLLSIVASSEGPKEYSLYEWVDPNTFAGKGAVPFRTGISAIRLAIADIAIQISSSPTKS